MSFYNEYAVIPTRTPNYEQYHTLNQIPKIKYLGSRGDDCKTKLDCHQRLECINEKCRDWIPPNTSIKEKFRGVPGEDYYQLSPDYDDYPITTKASSHLEYTSKMKANSGRNYW